MASTGVPVRQGIGRLAGSTVGLLLTTLAVPAVLYAAYVRQPMIIAALLGVAGVVLLLVKPRVAAIGLMLLWAGPIAVDAQIRRVGGVPVGAADVLLWLGTAGLLLSWWASRLRSPRQRDLFAAPVIVFMLVVVFAVVRGIRAGNALGTASDAFMATSAILSYFLFTRAYRARLGVLVGDIVAVTTLTNLVVIVGAATGMSARWGTVVADFYTRGVRDSTLRIDAPAQRLAALAILLIVTGLPHVPRAWRRWGHAALAVMVISVFLTLTRSTWLPLLAAAIVAPALASHHGALRRLASRLVVVGLCAGVLGGIAYTGAMGSYAQSVAVRFASAADSNVAQDDSYQQRVVEDVAASERISEEPVWGIGFPRAYGAYVPYYQPYTNLLAYLPRYFIHNSYLGVVMWMGLPGVAALAFLAWRLGTVFRLAWGAGRVDRRVPLAAAGALLVLAASSSFQTNLMFRPYYVVMALVLAVLQLWWERKELFAPSTDARPMGRHRWTSIGGTDR